MPAVFLVRKMAMGDVLWIEPVIRQLASKHRRVVVYTRYPELFLNHPSPNVRFTDRLSHSEQLWRSIGKALPFTRLHIGLDRAYEDNPKVHILAAYQQAAGLPETREYPRLYLSEAEKQYRPAKVGAGKYVVLHLESFAAQTHRKVYGVDWERIVSGLADQSIAVVLIGKDPAKIPGAIIVASGIRELVSLIRNALFFVGIDSGPSHIAAALGVPALIFFGAVNPNYRHFEELLKGHILQGSCECAGWYHESQDAAHSVCRLSGTHNAPRCAVHTTSEVRQSIERLIGQHQLV